MLLPLNLVSTVLPVQMDTLGLVANVMVKNLKGLLLKGHSHNFPNTLLGCLKISLFLMFVIHVVGLLPDLLT